VGNASPSQTSLDKLKSHYRDVFLAAVVEPKLKRTDDKGDSGIFVDNLFTDWDLAHELYEQIISYTYGKKKLMQTSSQKTAS
jgi:hypothetical protein